MKVKYLRLERPITGSFLTVGLPTVMEFDEAEDYSAVTWSDWEVIHGSIANPDEGTIFDSKE